MQDPVYSDKRFQDQVAIVTGGADGIGRAVSERLVREGATVAVLDRDERALQAISPAFAAIGGRSEVHQVDVGEEAAVSGCIEEIVAQHGRLDILVHCAGVVGPNGKVIEDVGVDAFDAVYRVNLRGSFLVTREAVRHMKPRGYGRVLLFASIAGKEGNPGMCAYSASKAGVIGLVKAVGKEVAGSGVTVNAIAPAVIRTALVEGMDSAQVEYMTSRIPMKRCGTLEEAAALTCWIVSREAGFNTGFVFDLSGGRATY